MFDVLHALLGAVPVEVVLARLVSNCTTLRPVLLPACCSELVLICSKLKVMLLGVERVSLVSPVGWIMPYLNLSAIVEASSFDLP